MTMLKTPQPVVTMVIWAVLAVAAIAGLVLERWSVAFISVTVIGLTLLPELFVSRFQVKLPKSFLAAISLFLFGTLFLGEVFDFYERLWWWDILLHGGSAIAFGLVGFLFVFFLFEGDKYAAPPIALAFVAFCFAMTIGALWEIFEFTMDQTFGLNMQKSGLMDTMGDLIVDAIGATVGAASGFIYLKSRSAGGPVAAIREFIRLNRHHFRKSREP